MDNLSIEEFKALAERGRRSKYNNNRGAYYDPVTHGTLKFDSQKEYEYYLILNDRLKRGEISDLKRQVDIEILPSFVDKTGAKHRAMVYKADFVYRDKDGAEHIVDCKGMRTEVYKMKKKLLAFKGIIIEEV